MPELNIPRIGTEAQNDVRLGSIRRACKSIRRRLLCTPLLQWARSRAAITCSLAHRSRVLFRTPVGWVLEFPPDLIGETGYKWTHDCTNDILPPLENNPASDLLDYRTAVQAWRRGAEWGFRNACRRFDIDCAVPSSASIPSASRAPGPSGGGCPGLGVGVV